MKKRFRMFLHAGKCANGTAHPGAAIASHSYGSWFPLIAPVLVWAVLLVAGSPASGQVQRMGAGPITFFSGSSGFTNRVATPLSLSGYVPDNKYKLRLGDKVTLQILEDRDLPLSLVVTDSGELDVPYIGRVAVAGKTCKQVVSELKEQLEKELYYRATVMLALDEANKLWGRVYVYGQVKNQGPIDVLMHEHITAGKAILRAGGFGDFANKKKVRVVRGAGTDGSPKQTFELNMMDILENGMVEKDVPLEPEDSVVVTSRNFSM